MAGFSIIVVSLVMLFIIGIVYMIFQFCAILGIIFSLISLVQSDRFIKTEGRTNFRTATGFNSTKGINTAATVFFVISCFVGAITLLLITAAASEMKADPETDFNIASLFTAIVIGCGTQIACVVLKIISAKRFSEARGYRESLYSAETVFANGSAQPRVYAAADSDGCGVLRSEKLNCPKCGAENDIINRFCVHCGEALKNELN